MWFGVISLFPAMFQAVTRYGVTRKAIDKGILKLQYWNPRDFALDLRQTVDGRPYGGGPGMVMKAEPLRRAIQAARRAVAPYNTRVIYLSPQGKPVVQEDMKALALESHIILLSGRYEGIDERLNILEVDEEWSIGDYVLTGGELAAMVVIDAVSRWVPGVLGDKESALQDSFSSGLLDCPHYTRPQIFGGLSVPPVLYSGNHAEIAKWRFKQRLQRTAKRRPDLSPLFLDDD